MSYVNRDHLTNSQPAELSHAEHHGLADLIAAWRTRLRDRRELATLDDRDLRDARLTRWDVERELAKPFWRD
ncbi:DUF1127 domain-containing protein [Acidisphaera rubrifaciens]|uniref:DUF1127 domain-containing protein n=1 Tax=Acidisphaera rubrifaciens HS-AP3 TaxID=1231350 RepID=A0A0D6P7T6_9PROT|nr:hypothetical protein [Acidisphaera rubrifaciens]GAN77717.1 hypothetical protein Asru_0428_03 [Acidisphaera rubrifaciens HS-AP3]